jgi:serine/threonine protein kinase
MLESGQELSARFVLVRRLGAGGSGEVWLAQDRERECFVAVKILDGRALPRVAAKELLRREFDRLCVLDHPNVLRIDSLYRSAQHAWITMDYASGGDLSQLRGRGAAEILRALVPVAGALAYAHQQGIVHRDVKTSNVLFKSDGTPLLADFGLALALDVAPSGAAGRGSPYSMSRQQASGAPASVADDMYGFGAMLFELFTGYPPSYPDANSEKHPELPATVPSRVAGLARRLLAPVAEDRPADMCEVERELKAALAELPAPTIMNTTNEGPPAKIEPPTLRPPVAQGEPLRSEWRRAAPAAHDAEDLRRQGFRRGVGAAAVGIGLAGIVVVFPCCLDGSVSASPSRSTSRRRPPRPLRRRQPSRRRKPISPRSRRQSRKRTISDQPWRTACRRSLRVPPSSGPARSSVVRRTSSLRATKITRRASTHPRKNILPRWIPCSIRWRSERARCWQSS